MRHGLSIGPQHYSRHLCFGRREKIPVVRLRGGGLGSTAEGTEQDPMIESEVKDVGGDGDEEIKVLYRHPRDGEETSPPDDPKVASSLSLFNACVLVRRVHSQVWVRVSRAL